MSASEAEPLARGSGASGSGASRGEIQNLDSLAELVDELNPALDRVYAFFASMLLALWVLGWLLLAVDWALEGAALWRSISLAVVYGIFSGLAFVLIFHLAGASTARVDELDRVERLFSGDPGMMPPPPAGARYRLICSVIVGKGRASGAALYVTGEGLKLVSHYPGRPWWRRRMALERDELLIGPPTAITLETGIWRLTWWQKTLMRIREPEVLLVNWPGNSIGLRVANVREVTARLQSCLDELRATSQRS